MSDFIHVELFHFFAVMMYGFMLFGMIFVGVGMVYLHHVLGWPRFLAAAISFPPAVPMLIGVIVFLCNVGVVASMITAVLLFLLGIGVWIIAVLYARQRFAPFAAADIPLFQLSLR